MTYLVLKNSNSQTSTASNTVIGEIKRKQQQRGVEQQIRISDALNLPMDNKSVARRALDHLSVATSY